MTNYEAMDKDDLAEALAHSNDRCKYCLFYGSDICEEPESCIDGIRMWFDEPEDDEEWFE